MQSVIQPGNHDFLAVNRGGQALERQRFIRVASGYDVWCGSARDLVALITYIPLQ